MDECDAYQAIPLLLALRVAAVRSVSCSLHLFLLEYFLLVQGEIIVFRFILVVISLSLHSTCLITVWMLWRVQSGV